MKFVDRLLKRPDLSKTLAQYDELISDSRAKRIWYTLLEQYPPMQDYETKIATYVQPRMMIEDDSGLSRPYAEQAVFVMVSPHPHPRHKGSLVKTTAFTALSDFRDGEKERRHSSTDDLALDFFRQMAPEHLREMRNWKELN